MAIDWDKIKREYEITDIKLCDLGKKHGIKYPTIKSQKQRHGWAKRDASKESKDASGKKKGKGGAPLGSKNALGNKGGKGAPPGNNYALKHGFFKLIFPDDEDTRAILDEIQLKSPLEILWDQIQIQYLAIARAQNIMWVRDHEDTSTSRVGYQKGKVSGERWEVQYAWDKHASFLTAQSRAIQTLERLIARYEQLLQKDMETEEQQLRMEKLKAEIARLKGEEGDLEDDGFLDALQGGVVEVWANDED